MFDCLNNQPLNFLYSNSFGSHHSIAICLYFLSLKSYQSQLFRYNFNNIVSLIVICTFLYILYVKKNKFTIEPILFYPYLVLFYFMLFVSYFLFCTFYFVLFFFLPLFVLVFSTSTASSGFQTSPVLGLFHDI